jgi:superoxide dismutase, Fe-Mn family
MSTLTLLSRRAAAAAPAAARRAFSRSAPAAAGGGNGFVDSTLDLAPAALPDLPYAYDALEPTISAEIMEIHHSKHHNAYVTNYNLLLPQLQEAEKGGAAVDVGGLEFNLGGHINHDIFWTNLAPAGAGGGGAPTGELAAAIDAAFGSFDAFKAEFKAKSVGVQGSGWGWLGYDKANGTVVVETRPNQVPLEHTTGLVPLLGVDVWEHAYYLQYKNVRPDYVEAIWDVVNWGNVSERFAAAKQ